MSEERARLVTHVVVFGAEDGALYVPVVQRKDDPHKFWWEFPGGPVSAGEDIDQAARRSLRRQTGLEAVDLTRCDWYGATNRHQNGRTIGFAFMGALPDKPELVAGEGVGAVRWVLCADILKKRWVLAFDNAEILEDVHGIALSGSGRPRAEWA